MASSSESQVVSTSLAESGRGVHGRLEAWLGTRRAGWGLVGGLALVYTVAYLMHSLNPGSAAAELRVGWWGWADQFAYWKSAKDLAHGQILAANYHYSLGYPALGALSWHLSPTHAFFLPNLLLVLGTGWGWWRLARRWLDRVATLLAGVVFVGTHHSLLALTMVVPWNTVVTQLTLLAGMVVIFARRDAGAVGWLTALAGVTYLVRPGDAACFAPMLVWSVWRLPTWRERIICGVSGMAGIAVVVMSVRALNTAIFGTPSTPYESMTWEAIGFFSYPILPKLYWLFVDGSVFFAEVTPALLFRYPWLVLAVPGVIFAVRREGGAAVAALLTLALNWGLYLHYNDFFPSGIYRYSLIHYLTWGFIPLFTLAVAAAWSGRQARSVRVGWVVALGVWVVASGLQLEPQRLPLEAAPGRIAGLPTTGTRWVRWPGLSAEQVGRLRLDGQPLRENKHFQMPYTRTAELRVLLSAQAQGAVLTVDGDLAGVGVPEAGTYRWGWRFDATRWWRGW